MPTPVSRTKRGARRLRVTTYVPSQALAEYSVRRPVASSTSKRLDRHISQTICQWNKKFSQHLTERAFDARPASVDKDAQMLARNLLQMSQAEFSAAFKNSPMKRATRRGLQRNTLVVMGNVGTDDDVPRIEAMLQH